MALLEVTLEVMVKAEAGEEVGVEAEETGGGGVALVLEAATVAGEGVRWEEGAPLVVASAGAAGVVTRVSGRRTFQRSILPNSGRRRKG